MNLCKEGLTWNHKEREQFEIWDKEEKRHCKHSDFFTRERVKKPSGKRGKISRWGILNEINATLG